MSDFETDGGIGEVVLISTLISSNIYYGKLVKCSYYPKCTLPTKPILKLILIYITGSSGLGVQIVERLCKIRRTWN